MKQCKIVELMMSLLTICLIFMLGQLIFSITKGDRFKVIYTEKFVDDSITIGIDRIKAAFSSTKENHFMLLNILVILKKE